MSFLNSRRGFLIASASAAAVGLAACDAVSVAPTYGGDGSNGPVLSFEKAVAKPSTASSFLNDVTGEKLRHFDSIWFVNKSRFGAYSQTLAILEPDQKGVANTVWRMKHRFDVSTGREREERYFTTTPKGLFTLDPNRMYRDYQSQQWDGADMPFAMFWDYVYPNGRPTGIAFHAATGVNEYFVGIRASGGCIRTKLDDSEEIWNLARNNHAGPVPVFEPRNPHGILQYNSDGSVRKKDGYRILIVVEDNDNILWEPFVSEASWGFETKRNQSLANSVDHEELVAGGQN